MSATSPALSPAPTYAAVLRIPHVRRTFGAALLGRLSNGTAPLSLLLSVKTSTGSYAAAGTVMAVWGLTAVLLSPARAALVDRLGPRRALPPLALGYALLLTALAVAAAGTAPPLLTLMALAGAAGAVTPPLGPVMRAQLSAMIPDRDLLRRAYSLDTVAEELLFVSGPLLVGLLTGYAPAAAGLAVSAGLVLTGTLALVTSPVVRGGAGRKRADASEASGAETGTAIPARTGVVRAVAVAASMGVCLGAFDLLVIAFADAHHRPGVVPWAMSALSAGSAAVWRSAPWTYGSPPPYACRCSRSDSARSWRRRGCPRTRTSWSAVSRSAVCSWRPRSRAPICSPTSRRAPAVAPRPGPGSTPRSTRAARRPRPERGCSSAGCPWPSASRSRRCRPSSRRS
ncbi:MFS transporter [Streptomyces gardneri]|uniref:MFS transporter n=1 Tax=Streptomyces gardneri TaxID=66892 RepID=UPI0033D93C8F